MSAQPLEKPVRFGSRYHLTELLAVGGMAEIYRARQDAIAGFEKDLVIKRLKPKLAADPRTAEMFLDEARISAVLNHPNIVHVYDVDEHDGVPFIAMELIHGEELNQLCRRGLSLGRFLPLAHAVELMRQAATGMGYYHARRDAGGDELDIVHCDISPTNLLVTQEGGMKVIDFGIARASNQTFRDHGALPGKLSYMSPEQARNESIDWRTDIFALGVILYEITLGKRLFRGKADDVVERVRNCDIQAPTFVRNDYPGQLEAVVMRALEANPEDRYQSAFDMADELEEFLRDSGLRSGPMRIARYLDGLDRAAGGDGRPELVSEAERRAEEEGDALDFDRGVFDSFQAAVGGSEADAIEWDELDEENEQVAQALGVDPSRLDTLGAKLGASPPAPLALAQSDAERGGDDDHEPDAGQADGDSAKDASAKKGSGGGRKKKRKSKGARQARQAPSAGAAESKDGSGARDERDDAPAARAESSTPADGAAAKGAKADAAAAKKADGQSDKPKTAAARAKSSGGRATTTEPADGPLFASAGSPPPALNWALIAWAAIATLVALVALIR